uniref:Uncharacterized protein n=1 Tax=Arcella intermedia TaxID=1963864 RepID=A0A6B2LB19_9EUKA
MFDIETETYQEIHPSHSPPAHSRMRIVTINDTLYSFGGILQDKKKLNQIYTFNLVSKDWEVLPGEGIPPNPRCDPVMYGYKNKIIIYGGSEENLIFPNDLHVFDIDKKMWYKPECKGNWPSRRIGCFGTVIHQKLYIYGGGDYNRERESYDSQYDEIWSLDLESYTWKQEITTGISPKSPIFSHWFSIGHHIVVIGINHCYFFDTVSHYWDKIEVQQLPPNPVIGLCVLANPYTNTHNHQQDPKNPQNKQPSSCLPNYKLALHFLGLSMKIDLHSFAFLYE